ncbi:MAG: hypothetical protein IPL99_04820 [Candidatus Competibacteraceae bacterium]|nr:hypothetical protein [Candidatus Competibacteraceae bacterium]
MAGSPVRASRGSSAAQGGRSTRSGRYGNAAQRVISALDAGEYGRVAEKRRFARLDVHQIPLVLGK